MKIFTILGILSLCSITAYSQTLKEKAESGDKVAQYQYAQKISDRMFPSEEDLSEAVQWLTKSALQGYAPAQCNLGYCFDVGKGVKKDSFAAVNWYKKSANQGNMTAQYNLGVCYAYGQGVPQSDYTAFSWYKKSAEQGYAIAENALAKCYYYGTGTATNNNLAYQWFVKAAEKKNVRAMFYLGECYNYGYGVQKNLKTAIEWYEKASDEDDMLAEYALAQLYLSGMGVEKDSIYATELLLHSAAGGFCSPDNMWNAKEGYNKALNKMIDLTRIFNSPSHHYFLAMLGCYYQSRDDYTNAEKYYKMAVEENSALGVIELGLMYFYIMANAPGYSVPGYNDGDDDFDNILGLESYKMENNDSVVSYLKRKQWTENDNETFWLERAIEYGHGDFTYGSMGYSIYDHLLYAYVDGIGSRRNLERAVDIATLGLLNGSGVYNSQESLEIALTKPELQVKVFQAYKKIYEKYCSNVNEKNRWCYTCSIAGLGKCYYKGLGTDKNYKLAFNYLSEAAEDGDCESMRLLAACYRYGRGTTANKFKDNEWVNKAAKCGDDKAKKIKERRNK